MTSTFPGRAAIRDPGADTLALSHSLGPGSALTRIFDARELGRETPEGYFDAMKDARCGCGALRVQVKGEREAVVACACADCRRRSGGPFGMGVYYKRDQLTFIGEAREYTRPTESGNTFTNAFCPTCATSLYWWGSRDPSRIGVAVGCFDPSEQFPPDRSVYDVNKQDWVQYGDVPGFERGRDSKRTR